MRVVDYHESVRCQYYIILPCNHIKNSDYTDRFKYHPSIISNILQTMDKGAKTMKALMLQGPGKFAVCQIPIPKPADGEVLIKVMAAPINPSDLIFLDKAIYATGKSVPCVPGFEGSGIVVENGGGIIGWSLMNKKVAFSPVMSSGTYAQYAVAASGQCLPVDEDLSFEHASMSFVNPLTAIAMLDILKSKSVKGVILTAAASALGRMLNRFLPSEGIRIINIVRREEQVEVLKKEGATDILNSQTEDFEARLTELSASFKATVCFDAIGGDFTGTVLKCMPRDSTIYVYGLLSGKNVGNIDGGEIVTSNKVVTGLFLPNWMQSKGVIKLLPTMLKLRKLLMRELKSQIGKEFSIDDFGAATKHYKENMTKGKVIIRPWAVGNSSKEELLEKPMKASEDKKEESSSKKKENKEEPIQNPKTEAKKEEKPVSKQIQEDKEKKDKVEQVSKEETVKKEEDPAKKEEEPVAKEEQAKGQQ